ncbi:MAG: aminoacetone oxidase family FAD-binding enzyme [Clostridiales bacterium]|nr:aminoacetone oxidase family FAD-binding enzyme [Candidatus Scatonaster coprocaballi]
MTEDKVLDLIIVGGGASGMCAAISYQQTICSVSGEYGDVLILEKNDRVGKKVLATGNGRCNLSNHDMSLSHFHSHRGDFPSDVIGKITQNDVLGFLAGIGILTVSEGEKLFPMSKQASSVVDAFRFALSEYQIQVETTAVVEEIKSVEAVGNQRLYRILLQNGRVFFTKSVILACGGACAPALGTTGDGYRLLASLGHKVYAPKPSIVQITTDPAVTRLLNGLKVDCRLTLLCEGQSIATQDGEVLFTDYGLSGPAAFQVSGEVSRRVRKGILSVPMQISLCLFEKQAIQVLREALQQRIHAFAERPVEQLLLSVLPAKIGAAILKNALNRPLTVPISSLSEADIERVLTVLQDWRFKVTGTKSLEFAQTTIGGASCDEFNSKTMESLIQHNLYGCGEVLDVDGDCGGYNLQWAFSSGILAGQSAAHAIWGEQHAK